MEKKSESCCNWETSTWEVTVLDSGFQCIYFSRSELMKKQPKAEVGPQGYLVCTLQHFVKSMIARRNIYNLIYADDTTLMAESEEELKSLLMKRGEWKSGLKTQHSEN